MKLIFIGDIFGKSGRNALNAAMADLKAMYQPDFIIANGENLADGKGLTDKTASQVFDSGVDLLTGGNHLWDRADSLQYLAATPRIVKPLNYPATTPGSRFFTLQKGELKLSVINLCGQVYMPPCDSPFNALEHILPELHEISPCILLDFHAESTAEKRAMAWFADGKISVLAGTHTHIQTADEEILPQGTAYITDVGMTGPHDSVIGVKKAMIVEKFRTSIPVRYESSDWGLEVNAVYVELDDETGQALHIKRIKDKVEIR